MLGALGEPSKAGSERLVEEAKGADCVVTRYLIENGQIVKEVWGVDSSAKWL